MDWDCFFLYRFCFRVGCFEFFVQTLCFPQRYCAEGKGRWAYRRWEMLDSWRYVFGVGRVGKVRAQTMDVNVLFKGFDFNMFACTVQQSHYPILFTVYYCTLRKLNYKA